MSGKLYTIYVSVMFVLVALLFVPLLILLGYFPRLHRLALGINVWWARVFFTCVGIRISINFEFHLDRKQQWIFCANHFSYMDIPVICALPVPFKFIGKKSLTKIPFFGLMFRLLHITVERSDRKSRANSLKDSDRALREGFNLVFFPEGGILSKEPPKMVPFKDGAFRLAVAHQVPIVPITMPYNYILLPDDGGLHFRRIHCVIKVHPPVYPADCNNDVADLKEKVKLIMDQELMKYEPENVSTVS